MFSKNLIRKFAVSCSFGLALVSGGGPATELRAQAAGLDGTAPLTQEGDLAAQMVAGIGRYLDRELDTSVAKRAAFWRRDLASPEAYARSVQPNRDRLRTILGVVDQRLPGSMEMVGSFEQPALVGEGAGFKVWAVRWPVLAGVNGEGLLLAPDKPARADIVALPDCEWTPEALAGLEPGLSPAGQFARRLAEAGVRVLIPTLIDRGHEFSERAGTRRMPHREYIFSPAFQMGRHLIGYEVQKVLAGVDWFRRDGGEKRPVGVVGYGEGGLVALYAGALDERIAVVGVSGYFQPRERLWSEPIDREIWGLLEQFGDAEIATLVAPRSLVVETSPMPAVNVPAQPNGGRSPHAPGSIVTPPGAAVESEVARARALVAGLATPFAATVVRNDQGPAGSDAFLNALLPPLGVGGRVQPAGTAPKHLRKSFAPRERLRRQFQEILDHTQTLVRAGQDRRTAFWAKADASSVESWQKTGEWYRNYLWDEIIGRLPQPAGGMNPRTRLIYDEPAYRGYEVVLDLYPDVVSYGILLIPKDLKPGERRPVVVCQHGLEGRAQEVADPRSATGRYMRGFAAQLAQRGFITFAAQNPYLGGDDFRVLVRKAHPLKQSLYSFMVRQHERTLEWFASLPFVDARRMAYYGISYGGKAVLRVGALLPQYSVAICSGDFNEWVRKTASTTYRGGYVGNSEYEMYEFDLGNTISHAEMSWLIFPRPFMVERGHADGVGSDEWVAYEYARTFRHYDLLGLADRTRIEYFNGPHLIYGIGAFEFLHKHLQWPMRGL
jgi:dienelactone hydrolase